MHSELEKSLERRTKHVMIQVLTQFESNFESIKDSESGKLFRFNVRNIMNDFIRATRDEMKDYRIDFRPMFFKNGNILHLTKTFIESVQKIYFDDKPGMHIVSDLKYKRVLEAIRSELNVGVIHTDQQQVFLSIYGLRDCVNRVIPFMDKFVLSHKVQGNYQAWRQEVANRYKGVGDE